MKEEIKAGIIILSSFIILSGFVILVGGSSFFEKFDTYYVTVMNSGGLEEGAQVRLGGVRVGRVVKIAAPTAPGKPVTVTIGVKTGTSLYKGTKALISQVGMVGDIYLLLSLSKSEGERMTSGSVIPSQEQVQFDEIMAKFSEMSQSMDNLIKDVNDIFNKKNRDNIARVLEHTDTVLTSGAASMEKITASLKSSTGKLDLVLTEIEDLMKGNKGEVSILIKKARESMDKAGSMIQSIEETSRTVDKTAQSVGNAFAGGAHSVENLINTLQKTTQDLQEIMFEVKSKPWSVIYKETGVREE